MSRKKKTDVVFEGPGGGAGGAVAPGRALVYLGGGLTGAWSGPDQGQLYWPQTDTTRDVDSYSRHELMMRARWVFGNTGLGSALLHGMARQVVGTGLMVRPLTKDKEWNRRRLELWNRRAAAKGVWDVSGNLNLRGFQYWAKLAMWRDGDVFIVPTKSATGRAMFGFYEGHAVGTGRYNRDEGWHDGVLAGRNRRAIKYRFLEDEGRHADLMANSEVWHCKDAMSPLALRGVTALKHAIGNFTDRAEIMKFWKEAIKATANWGIVLESETQANATANPMGSLLVGSRDPVAIPIEEVWGQGGTRQQLPSGTRATYIHDDRPHPNARQLLEDLIREVATGFGVPPELVWNVIALGGTGVRMVLKIAERFVIVQQQALIDDLLGRMYVYDTAVAIKVGDLPMPQDEAWYHHAWMTPERITVDVGRDGKLSMELQKSMMLTMRQHWGGQGIEWEEAMDQWFAEATYREEKVDAILAAHEGWTRDRLIPTEAGAVAPPDNGGGE